MERFTSAPLYCKLAFGAEAAGFLFGIIGIPTPYWVSVAGYSAGLFQVCFLGVCQTIQIRGTTVNVGTTFSILGLLAGIACLGIILLVTILEVIAKPTSTSRTVTTVLAFFAGNSILAACIAFGALVSSDSNVTVPFGWSFGLTIVAAIFHLVAGVLLILDKRAAMN